MPVYALSEALVFPDPRLAREDGLLAVGGDLSEKRLLLAYSLGIFPWFSQGDPILWWSPDPRLILMTKELKVSRRLKRILRSGHFHVTMDQAFSRVVEACAKIRAHRGEETWILPEMIEAYCRLHDFGFAHSVEAWADGDLAGGLYGVSLGRCFFGESMFTNQSNASKVALVTLAHHLEALDCDWIDCQVTTSHLMALGAKEVDRETFLGLLKKAVEGPTLRGKWTSPLPSNTELI